MPGDEAALSRHRRALRRELVFRFRRCEHFGLLDVFEAKQHLILPLRSIEGCLLTQPERTDGMILVNANSSPRRRRFTIAHELAHFLIATHEPDDDGFACRSDDMIAGNKAGILDPRKRQEAEANLFAINLLAPVNRCQSFLKKIPDLEKIVALADDLEISREAAARRYVELHPKCAAVVFARSGRVLYFTRHNDFPFINLKRGDQLPPAPGFGVKDRISDHVETEAGDWLGRSHDRTLVAQRLRQENEHEMILLAFDVE